MTATVDLNVPGIGAFKALAYTEYLLLSDRLILRQDIPYIRPLKAVPREIKRQLPPEFTRILTVNVSLNTALYAVQLGTSLICQIENTKSGGIASNAQRYSAPLSTQVWD